MIKNSIWINLYMIQISWGRKILLPECHRFLIVFLHFVLKCWVTTVVFKRFLCQMNQAARWLAGKRFLVQYSHTAFDFIENRKQNQTKNTASRIPLHIFIKVLLTQLTHIYMKFGGRPHKVTLKATVNSTTEDWCNFKNEASLPVHV